MSRQHLTAAAPGVEAAVVAMAAAHAQVASAAELSIGIRTEGTTRADVRAALADGTLTKTIGPRGTVHLLPTCDLGLWLGALDSLPVSNGLPAAARLSDEQQDQVIAAIGAALHDGADLTADELDDRVVAATGAWAADPVVPAFGGWWPRWRQANARAASAGVLAYGAGRGPKATYARPPAFTVPDDPAADLLREYLHSYGPATHREFAQWLAAPLGWAASVFERAEIEAVHVEGGERWVNHGDTGFADAPATGIRLLPYFDPYAVGSHPRALLFPGRAAERALSRGQAGVFPVLLVDGAVGGVWHHKRSGKRIAVTVEPLRALRAAQVRELEERVERIGEILEGAASLTIGEVSVGPHA
jgi:hypothetical protein